MKKSISHFALPLLVALSLSHAPLTARAEGPEDILIIANKGVPVDAIDIKALKAIFLKERATWRGGDKVNAINPKAGTNLRQRFQELVLEMTQQAEQRYWQDQKIQKGITPPPEFTQVTRAVFSIKGSISYVFRKDYQGDVAKVLLVLPEEARQR